MENFEMTDLIAHITEELERFYTEERQKCLLDLKNAGTSAGKQDRGSHDHA